MITLSFNIRSPFTEAFEAETKMLILECTPGSCTVLLWNMEKKEAEAVEVFTDIKDWEKDWESMVSQSSILVFRHLHTKIFYGFSRFLPIPASLFSPSTASLQLKALSGEAPGWHYGADVLVEESMVMYWEAPMVLRKIFSAYFQHWQPNSLASLLINLHRQLPRMDSSQLATGLFLLSGNEIWVALWRQETLLIIQNYKTDEPVTVSYHMLNICQQWSLLPEQITWYGYGMMDPEAPLWLSVEKFFGSVEPANPGIPFGKGTPVHYFAHLIQYLAHLKYLAHSK